MSRWTRSLPVLAVVGAVSVAGCGGSDYPGKANDICKDIAKKIKSVPKPKSASPGDYHIFFIRYTKIVSDAVGQFKAIKPPSDKQAPYQAYLAGLDRELLVLRRATNTVASNPTRAVTLLQQQASLSQNVNSNAKAAGLTKCAKPA